MSIRNTKSPLTELPPDDEVVSDPGPRGAARTIEKLTRKAMVAAWIFFLAFLIWSRQLETETITLLSLLVLLISKRSILRTLASFIFLLKLKPGKKHHAGL